MKYRYVAKVFVWFLIGVLFLSSNQVFARPNTVIHMPGDQILKHGDDDNDALPSDSDVSPRAPGMQLPADENHLANPFAPVKKERPKTPEEVESTIRNQAFTAALTGLLPLKPNEIRKLLETFDETRQAVETPIYPDPQPESIAQTISLDPGTPPMEIKLATGRVTTISFIDITGEPWPIGDIAWAGNFEIDKPKSGSYVMRIIPQSEFANGNMSVTMPGLKAPLIFMLKTHRDKVFYRLDIRIPDYGPFAKQPLIEGSGPTLSAGDSVQAQVLDGVKPAGAVKLSVAGVDNRTTAYRLGSITYLRTPLAMLSPSWSNSVSSADGMSVYTIANSPVVLLSDKGSVVQASLSDRDLPKESTASTTSMTVANTSSSTSTPVSAASATAATAANPQENHSATGVNQ